MFNELRWQATVEYNGHTFIEYYATRKEAKRAVRGADSWAITDMETENTEYLEDEYDVFSFDTDDEF